MNDSNSSSHEIVCGACGSSEQVFAGSVPFYLQNGAIQTTIWRCEVCASYTRDCDMDDPLVRTHFDVASFTRLEIESDWRQAREGFFRSILKFARDHLGSSLEDMHTLDIGTSYGHMLEILKQEGARPEGVEIVSTMRELAKRRGFTVYESTAHVPTDSRYRLITSIDSLYYANNPLLILSDARSLLERDGILILRVSNRAWLLRGLEAVGVTITAHLFDGSKCNFSQAGLAYLLHRAGLKIEAVYLRELGKVDPRPGMRIYYAVSAMASRGLATKITPGLIVVARPST